MWDKFVKVFAKEEFFLPVSMFTEFEMLPWCLLLQGFEAAGFNVVIDRASVEDWQGGSKFKAKAEVRRKDKRSLKVMEVLYASRIRKYIEQAILFRSDGWEGVGADKLSNVRMRPKEGVLDPEVVVRILGIKCWLSRQEVYTAVLKIRSTEVELGKRCPDKINAAALEKELGLRGG